jgi:hypothetical protein
MGAKRAPYNPNRDGPYINPEPIMLPEGRIFFKQRRPRETPFLHFSAEKAGQLVWGQPAAATENATASAAEATRL